MAIYLSGARYRLFACGLADATVRLQIPSSCFSKIPEQFKILYWYWLAWLSVL